MSMHTPGPWAVDDKIVMAQSREREVWVHDATCRLARIDTDWGAHDQAIANARLIAAIAKAKGEV